MENAIFFFKEIVTTQKGNVVIAVGGHDEELTYPVVMQFHHGHVR